MPRSTAHRLLDVWIWVLVFGGLLTLVLGLSMKRLDALWGWLIVAAGACAAVLGFVLWIVRSRRPDNVGH